MPLITALVECFLSSVRQALGSITSLFKPGVVIMPVIPALSKEEEDQEFQDFFGFIVNSSQHGLYENLPEKKKKPSSGRTHL